MHNWQTFTHSLKGLANYAKYHALSEYFFLFGQINIYDCLSDCKPFPPSLMLQYVVCLDIVWDINRKDRLMLQNRQMELEIVYSN